MNKNSINLSENTNFNPDFEKMLKTFLKQIDKSGILREVKIRRYYRKPSEIKREHNKKLRK
jgi:ribosomal protein S21